MYINITGGMRSMEATEASSIVFNNSRKYDSPHQPIKASSGGVSYLLIRIHSIPSYTAGVSQLLILRLQLA